MKIRHVVVDLDGGGAERLVSALVDEMCKLGHDADIVFGRDQTGASTRGICVPRMGPILYLRRLLGSPRSNVQQTVVHLHGPWTALAARVQLGRSCLPILYTAHSRADGKQPYLRFMERSSIASLSKRRFAPFRLTAVSANVCQEWQDLGLDPVLVPNGTYSRPTLGRSTDAPILVWAGRLVDVKRPSIFPKLLHDTGATGVIAGDGPLRRDVERAIEYYGVRCTLLGWIDDIHEVLERARSLVLTSESEGAPMVVLEAMAMGVPVIAPDLPGIREQVGPGYELLYPPGDYDGLRVSVVRLMSMSGRAYGDLRRYVSERQRVNFDIRRAAEAYCRVYSSLLEKQ